MIVLHIMWNIDHLTSRQKQVKCHPALIQPVKAISCTLCQSQIPAENLKIVQRPIMSKSYILHRPNNVI